jgi:hypothetical protein
MRLAGMNCRTKGGRLVDDLLLGWRAITSAASATSGHLTQKRCARGVFQKREDSSPTHPAYPSPITWIGRTGSSAECVSADGRCEPCIWRYADQLPRGAYAPCLSSLVLLRLAPHRRASKPQLICLVLNAGDRQLDLAAPTQQGAVVITVRLPSVCPLPPRPSIRALGEARAYSTASLLFCFQHCAAHSPSHAGA